jgi:ParB family transcriptional regulator, chromosome partitioning protein
MSEITELSNPSSSIQAVSRPLDAARIIPISLIDPNPYQPRHKIEAKELTDLTSSIHQNGILQPLLVCPNNERFHLIAGYRRLSAARLAELTEVPCTVKEMTNEEMLQFALIENLQRADLNPIEEAESIQKLMAVLSLTQEAVGQLINKSEGFISERLALIKLPKDLRERVSASLLPIRKALEIGKLGKEASQLKLANRAQSIEFNALQELVQKKLEKERVGRKRHEKKEMKDDFKEIVKELPGIRIYKDRISFTFKSEDDLINLLEQLIEELKGEQL